MKENRLVSAENIDNEEELSLRPQKLTEYIGQKNCKEMIDIYIKAAKMRKEAAFKEVKLPGGWMISANNNEITISGPAGKKLQVVKDNKEYTFEAGTYTF